MQEYSFLSDFSYDYYLDGNIKSETAQYTKEETFYDTHDGNDDVELKTESSYVYDDFGRLINEIYVREKEGETNINSEKSYIYDSAGNRTKMTYIKNNGKMRESESTDYTYDKDNKLITERKKYEEKGYELITDYKYDKNGNVIFTVTNKSGTNTDGKARLGISVLEDLKGYKYEERTYDGLNRMTKVRNTNGITEYKYRPDGLRLTKQTGEKEILYAWNGNQIIAEIEDSSHEKTNVYSYGRERIRKGVYFDDVEYYIYNAHGNVVQLAGETQYKHYAL